MLLSSCGISLVTFLLDKFLIQVIAISKNMYCFNFKILCEQQGRLIAIFHHASSDLRFSGL